MNSKVGCIVLFMLSCVIMIQCAGPIPPIYYRKDTRIETAEPTVYMLPSSCVGRFYYFEKKEIDGEERYFVESCAFDEWESFSTNVHGVFRKVCQTRGIAFELMHPIHPGWETLIACDTTAEYAAQYLSLESVYKDDVDNEVAQLNSGLAVVFTKFSFARVLQQMTAHARYYVYALQSGELVLVDEMERTYNMKAVLRMILADLGNDVLVQRMHGLWYDEKPYYVEVCTLFAGELIDQIIRKCLAN